MLNKIKLEALLSAMPAAESLKIRTYIGEADFYFSILKPDLKLFPMGSPVVEIGSGVGLLSFYIASLGYKVYSFEPESSGFTDMLKIKELIEDCWENEIPDVKFVNDYYSETYLLDNEKVEYFLAINVIEHIPDYANLIHSVRKKMGSDSIFRIICPNYLIPYEPHFDIPIFFNKKSTLKLLRGKILNSKIPNPIEFWNDLSWPTQSKLKRAAISSEMSAVFSRQTTKSYLERPFTDDSFSQRKNKLTFQIIKCVSKVLMRVLSFVPLKFMPMLDCKVKLNRS